jgi:hypothetical protein
MYKHQKNHYFLFIYTRYIIFTSTAIKLKEEINVN